MSGGVCFLFYHAFAVSREGFPDVQGPNGILHVSLDITDTISPPRLLYRSAMQSLSEHTQRNQENGSKTRLRSPVLCNLVD